MTERGGTDITPAELTTIRAAQPLPAILPSFLEPMPVETLRAMDIPVNNPQYSYQFKDIPPRPGPYASRPVLLDYLGKLEDILYRCLEQMSYDHAQKIIMEIENGIIRQKLWGKHKDRQRVTHVNTGARVLTSDQSIQALYEVDRKRLMGAVLKEMAPILKELRTFQDDGEKELIRKEQEEEDVAIKAHKIEQKALSELSKQYESAKVALARYD
ncbi:10373_t:CDS:2, partial [Acaulospora colombiana]